MSVQRIDFSNLLALWPTSEDKRAYVELAEDMGVPSSRARQWVIRNRLPTYYLPRFQCVLREKFGLIVTANQLAECVLREKSGLTIAGNHLVQTSNNAEAQSERALRAAETRKRKRESDNTPDCGKSPENEIEKDARG
jgi:hypothetical protein